MRNIIVFLAVAAVLQLTVSCSSVPSQVDNGSGHEWEARARITGIILDSADGPVSAAIVQLIPVDYNPLTAATLNVDTTDATGNYRFEGNLVGLYTVQAVHASKRTRVRSVAFTIANDTIAIIPQTLKAPGAVAVNIPQGISSGTVFIRGTDVQVRIGLKARMVTLDSLAPGPLPEILFAPSTDTTPKWSLVKNAAITVGKLDTLADLAIFTDGSSLVSGTWNSAGTLSLDSTKPFEGRFDYRFDYSYTNWSSQCGINFDNWLLSSPQDVRAYQALHCSYMGGGLGDSLYVQIFDVVDSSTLVLLGPASSTYQSVDVLLSKFTHLDLSRVREIMFMVVGSTQTGTGTLYLDDVRFGRSVALR